MLQPDQWTTSTRCSSNGCISARWTKSSYSSDSFNCLETRWHKSSHSGANGCIEACHHGVVQLRDSKLGDHSPILQFDPAAWTAFIEAVTSGEIAP